MASVAMVGVYFALLATFDMIAVADTVPLTYANDTLLSLGIVSAS